LRKNERFSMTFHSSPVAIAISDFRSGEFIDVNRMFQVTVGRGMKEIIGKTAYDLELYSSTAERERLTGPLAERGAIRNKEIKLKRKSGEIREALASFEKITLHGRECLLSMILDVTDRNTARANMSRMNRILSAIGAIQSDFIADQDPHRTYEKICGTFIDLVSGKTTFLFETARENSGLTCVQICGESPGVRMNVAGAAAAAAALQTGEIVRQKFSEGDKSGELVSLPLLSGREMTGVIVSYSEKEIRMDTAELSPLLTSCANIIAAYRNEARRKKIEIEWEHAHFHDPLTGLANRALFLDRLRQAMERQKRSETKLAVLVLDLYRFTLINDSLGNDAGDDLLIEIARRIASLLQPGDTAARIGGDEFAIILEEARSIGDAMQIAEAVRTSISRPFLIKGQEIFTAASTGIAVWNPGYEKAEDILRDADTAMFRARSSRSQIEIFDNDMRSHIVQLMKTETEIRRALEKGEFEVFYQPIVSLKTRKITSFEALVRWNHPVRGVIGPGHFISIAEETGLIEDLGKFVIEGVCAKIKLLNERGFHDLKIAVNVSARQFQFQSLCEIVERSLLESKIDGHSLVLEITETVAMEDAEYSARILSNLAQRGIQITIDDFGTGYSSLGYLRRFPIRSLKIDRSFIRDIPGDPEDSSLVRAIIAMANTLKLRVVAEGVERREQLNFLEECGCDELQGYFFSRPIQFSDAFGLLSLADIIPVA